MENLDPEEALWCTIKAGEELLKKKREAAVTDWGEWMTIGAGLAAGRALAMHRACANRSEGRRYSKIFSGWLKTSDYSLIDQDTRAALLRCHDQADAIERWRREMLTPSQQLYLNHPRSVWRRYLKWQQGSEPKPEKKRAGSKTREQQLVLELEERIKQHDAALGRADAAERRLQEMVQEKDHLLAKNAILENQIMALRSQVPSQAAGITI